MKQIGKRRGAAAGLLLALIFSLFGCGKSAPPTPAADVLAAMVETLGTSHTTRTYTRASDPQGGDYLSDTLFSALFGEASRGLLGGDGTAPADSGGATGTAAGTAAVPAAIGDAAVCLSLSPTPVELAVFRCSDARGTTTAAGIAQARLDTVRAAWVGTEWEALTRDGRVAVVGSYVLLIIAENPDAALSAARRAIG